MSDEHQSPESLWHVFLMDFIAGLTILAWYGLVAVVWYSLRLANTLTLRKSSGAFIDSRTGPQMNTETKQIFVCDLYRDAWLAEYKPERNGRRRVSNLDLQAQRELHDDLPSMNVTPGDSASRKFAVKPPRPDMGSTTMRIISSVRRTAYSCQWRRHRTLHSLSNLCSCVMSKNQRTSIGVNAARLTTCAFL